MKKIRIIIAFILIFSLLISFPLSAGAADTSGKEAVDIFLNIYQEYLTYHLEGRDGEEVLRTTIEKMLSQHPELLESVIDGMMDSGDRFSYYLTADEVNSFEAQKVYGGIGIIVKLNEKQQPVVQEVTPGSPAGEAGLLPGDILLSVGGRPLLGLTIPGMAGLFRGEAGTYCTVGVERGDQAGFFRLKRRSLPQTYVSYYDINESTRYIQISTFNDYSVIDQFMDAIAPLQKENCPIKNLIFDVRGNYGGYDTVTATLLDALTPKEGVTLFKTLDKNGDLIKEFVSSGFGIKTENMVVLADKTSASAAEVFAFCLQQMGSAKVIGTSTYGKSVGMFVFPQQDGSEALIVSLSMQAGNGKTYDDKGIIPDIYLENPPFVLPDLSPLDEQNYQSCTYGQKNSAVQALNDRLMLLGYLQKSSDVFGSSTASALCSLQHVVELKPTGQLDLDTLKAINESVENLPKALYAEDAQLNAAIKYCQTSH